MENLFTTYNQSLALKELGFDEPCFGIFIERGNKHDVIYVAKQDDAWTAEQNDGILASLKQQAFDFIESKYGLFYQKIDIKVSASETEGYRWRYCIYKIGEDEPIYVDNSLLGFLNSEELQNDCLDKMLEIIKKEKI